MNIKKYYLIVLHLFIVISTTSAQNDDSIEFQYDSIQMFGNNYRYGYLEPDISFDNKKFPLVLALHGAEWMDVSTQSAEEQFNFLFAKSGANGWEEFSLATCWKSSDFFNKHPAYVLVPHIHDDMHEDEDEDTYRWEDNYSISFLDSLIDKYIATGNIDTNRIYITGHSMGGRGTLLAYDKLKYKAAALIPCSPAIYDEDWTDNIKNGIYDHTAIWFFHPYQENPGNVFETFRDGGKNVTYVKSAGIELQNITTTELEQSINNRHSFLQTEYFEPIPFNPHMIMTFQVQDTLAYDWMFKQYRIESEAIKIINISRDDYRVEWQSSIPNDTIEFWFRVDKEWQMLTKGIFTQNTLSLSDYLNKENLAEGYLKICCVNTKNFVYGLDEQKISEINSSSANLTQENLTLVYPNPFKNHLKIDNVPDLKRCKLYNVMGEKVIEQTSDYLHTSELEQGVYFLRIDRDNEIIETIKLIKE